MGGARSWNLKQRIKAATVDGLNHQLKVRRLSSGGDLYEEHHCSLAIAVFNKYCFGIYCFFMIIFLQIE